MKHSQTEENYLKAIYNLNLKLEKGASTNAIAKKLATKASSVTDMLRKLDDKKLVNYKKYQGATLTTKGRRIAVEIIRKHRLWEVFLVDKLDFKWDEVHEIAEQLEHIQSKDLTERLNEFLQFPEHDPHGDPIPDKDGNIQAHKETMLTDMTENKTGIIVGVKDSSVQFLQYLESVGLLLGTELKVIQQFDFDQSIQLKLKNKKEITVSHQVAKNLYLKIKK